MAYQKLQAGKAWSLYTSDNTNIPDISVVGPTGTSDAIGAADKQLIDSARTGTDPAAPATLSFLLCGLKPGMIIINTIVVITTVIRIYVCTSKKTRFRGSNRALPIGPYRALIGP